MARVTANPQKNPAASRPALKPFPPAPATAKATKLSPRKTRTNVPSASPRYFLVQLSDTAILSSSLRLTKSRAMTPYEWLRSRCTSFWQAIKKALTCTLHLERIGQDFSLQCPASRLHGCSYHTNTDVSIAHLGRSSVRKLGCG